MDLVDLCRITGLSEKFRIAINNIIRDFCTNEDVSEFIFPSTLSNEQRKYVHEKCKRMGLLTKSLGREPNRKLHMSKQTKLYCKTFYLFHHENSYQSTSYLKQYREAFHQISNEEASSFSNNKLLGRLNSGGTVTVNEPVSSKFDSFRKNLPIWAKKEEFLNLMHSNQVVIITSETGSGKSTQIPQFILEDLCTKQTPGKIICTQPRRISTVAVAERVSEERGETLGGTIGYQIKLKYVCSPQSALIYCTNGILLKTLMSNKNQEYLMNISHIIVDEIHERDKYTDFLLIALKQNLDHYPHLKIILMSATADVDLFASYFNDAKTLHVPGRNHSITQLFLEDILSRINQNNSQGTTSHFIVPTTTPSTTHDLMYEFDLMNEVVSNCMETGDDSYFEQLLHLILSENSNVNHQTSKGYTPLMAAAAHGRLDIVEPLLNLGGNVALKSYWEGFTAANWAWHYAKFEVHHMLQAYESMLSENDVCDDDQSAALLEMYDRSTSDDVIDFNLIVKIIEYIHLNDNRGTILIFLPGYEDIIMCQDAILFSKLLNVDEFELFLLHGSMNINMQQGVFKTIRHKHKVILSTNVAETSLTISDVVYVIDTGRAKEKSYDSISGTCSLQKIWISKANVKQRAGRAGRTCPGICFHMFSKRRYFSLLDNQIPEMLRVPLHEVCLQTKYLAPSGVSIAQYLKLAIEPPSPMSVEMSIQNLKTLNALDKNEELTVLGQHLIQLSIDPKLGKMLIYAIVFRCLDPVLTIVSCLAYRDPFVIPLQSNLKQLSIKKQKELGGDYLSDHLILLRVFQLWQEARSSQNKKEVTEEYFISWSAMEIIYATRSQLLSHLRGMGFISMNKPFTLHDLNINSNNWPMVKGALAAGSYPNIAFNVNRHYATKNEKKVVFNKCSILSNLHPHTNRGTDYCIIYEELSKTGQHCSIRYGTVITPITVALMCGKEEIKEDNSLVIDDWLNFQQSNEILTEYRLALHEIINKKISCPEYTFNDVENSILKIVSKMLSDEEKMCQLAQPNDIGVIPKCFPVFSKTFMHNHHKRTNHTHNISNVVLSRLNITAPSASRSRSVQSAPENVSGNNWNYKINEKSQIVVESKSDKLLKALIPTNSYINGRKVTQDILPLHSLELPANTVFFIVKPPNYECLQKGISSSSWIFAPQSERKIFKCFVQGFYIILFFNILKTTEFQGFARLLSTNGGDTTRPCSIQWLSTTIVSFDIISQRNLRNPYNNNYLLFKCRDGQSVELNVGKQLCTLFLEEISMCEKVSRRPILGSIRNY
uniref:RNA helicase n=1 Tax=Photinus pyralis TaxID=7054 RepID=A0A1Y1L8Q9_PHOPY